MLVVRTSEYEFSGDTIQPITSGKRPVPPPQRPRVPVNSGKSHPWLDAFVLRWGQVEICCQPDARAQPIFQWMPFWCLLYTFKELELRIPLELGGPTCFSLFIKLLSPTGGILPPIFVFYIFNLTNALSESSFLLYLKICALVAKLSCPIPLLSQYYGHLHPILTSCDFVFGFGRITWLPFLTWKKGDRGHPLKYPEHRG